MPAPRMSAISQGFGYPLDNSVLYLRAIPSRFDRHVACGIEGGDGRHLGWIRPAERLPYTAAGPSHATFEAVDPGGMPILFISQDGGPRRQRLVVVDGTGRELGQLNQVSSWWRQVVSSTRITMAIESDEHTVARTDVSIDPDRPDARVDEPIRDTVGGVLATVERQRRGTGTATDYFDYKLNCLRVTSEPLPTLLLVTVFAHYLYDRLAIGGPMGMLGKAISRPTWER